MLVIEIFKILLEIHEISIISKHNLVKSCFQVRKIALKLKKNDVYGLMSLNGYKQIVVGEEIKSQSRNMRLHLFFFFNLFCLGVKPNDSQGFFLAEHSVIMPGCSWGTNANKQIQVGPF